MRRDKTVPCALLLSSLFLCDTRTGWMMALKTVECEMEKLDVSFGFGCLFTWHIRAANWIVRQIWSMSRCRCAKMMQCTFYMLANHVPTDEPCNSGREQFRQCSGRKIRYRENERAHIHENNFNELRTGSMPATVKLWKWFRCDNFDWSDLWKLVASAATVIWANAKITYSWSVAIHFCQS